MSGKESATGYIPYVDHDDLKPSSKPESNQNYQNTVIDPVPARE